ncbi:lipase, putative [Talaromyces stipitatus ATCC 10500]|uniref:Lipase, putative n=1 Tax=Talaromyces stipitatus (strain ATCC 10500 / CBS 375.48 / QM 6759 / NRRL 1006) TaxID=441959 RepID=B8MTK9_TALSN|nr:lipase, putative [Talaromyces stipitatus ATCC 10500]EED12415.1 lipase, putative [Talaromyces stipitatus ATCC 10500]
MLALLLLPTISFALAAIWLGASVREKRLVYHKNNVTFTGPDPVYLVDERQLDEAVSCPSSRPQAKGTVLLVHGTGMAPQINWEYTLVPPLIHEGFRPCYVAVPHRLFDDAQISAEYISHAIKKLADKNDTQISIISWSAGALITQWTLTFYPETRSKVKRHIALGPDYRGSWSMVPLFYFNMFTEAVVQQIPWSNFLNTLNRFGGDIARVPTTNIGSSTDLIVQPGFYGEGWPMFKDSWRLNGPQARNIDLFKLCAAKSLMHRALPHVVSHDSLLWEPASHQIIFDALNNEETYVGSADSVTFDHCRGGQANHLPPGSETRHSEIMPELVDYASKMPVKGWPEVPLRDYALLE